MTNAVEESFNRNPGTWIASIFGVVGVLVLAGGIYSTIQNYDLLEKSARAEGTVIALVEKMSTSRSTSSRGVSYYPKVSFQTPSGETITFTSKTGSNPASHDVGDNAEVLYAPENPSQAILHSFVHMWLLPLILLLAGAALTAISGCIIAVKIYGKRIEAAAGKMVRTRSDEKYEQEVDRLMSILDKKS